MCQTNDYSLLTANTGIGIVENVNPYLTGEGDITIVLTAGENGTVVKSVTIKSVPRSQFIWSQEGMVRLFIQNSGGTVTALYKEIPIPAVPTIDCTPLPPPTFLSFETVLMGDLKLQPGYRLVASTQVANIFNIIAEGVDWVYPDPVPDVCCNFEQTAAVTGIGVVSTANSNYDGSGTIVPVFAADAEANGTTIKSITIKALQSTHEGAIRLFISPDGENYSLMREVHIPQTEQSAYTPSFKQVIEMDFKLQAGYTIGASTQNAESFAITVEGESWLYPA